VPAPQNANDSKPHAGCQRILQLLNSMDENLEIPEDCTLATVNIMTCDSSFRVRRAAVNLWLVQHGLAEHAAPKDEPSDNAEDLHRPSPAVQKLLAERVFDKCVVALLSWLPCLHYDTNNAQVALPLQCDAMQCSALFLPALLSRVQL
jgi:hypothetical protein